MQDEGAGAMGYQQTLMYGRYSQALGEQLKQAVQPHRDTVHTVHCTVVSKNRAGGRGEESIIVSRYQTN